MDLYFAGAEIPGWRTLLRARGVRHQGLSYIGLSRRVKFARPWLIAEKFGPDVSVLLDSGAYTLNKPGHVVTGSELLAIADGFTRFAELNRDSIAIGVEFDAIQLPPETLRDHRRRLHDILSDRFLPVWHAENGLDELHRLADTYGRVGVTQTTLAGRDLVPTLRTLARSGIALHGVAMTKPDLMAALPWASAASTSWLSPSQYGDTIVWTGNELKRYPRRYKDQARLRHRTLFTSVGLDADAIAADDPTEVLKLSIWSWSEFMNHLNRGVSNTSANIATADNAEEGVESFDTPTPEKRKFSPPQKRSATSLLPGVGITEKTVHEYDEDGNRVPKQLPMLASTADSQRSCDTCFLSQKCPSYEPESTCAYALPVEARTPEQLARLQEVLIEIQVQRTLFARFSEETEGGYPDPNVSNEIDRLQKMLKIKHDMDSGGFSISMKVQSRNAAETGLIGQLFGESASAAVRAIEPVRDVDVAQVMGIVDAEEVTERI